ncbi:MAG: CcdB family protein [Pseudohongiellaceae bacterium]
MAQFDVYPNPNHRTSKAFPYLVDIQSPFIAQLQSRIVIPLARRQETDLLPLTRLTPEVSYEDEALLLFTSQIAAIPLKQLRNPVGSLRHIRDQIVASLDFAIRGV